MWHHFSSSIAWIDCWCYTNSKKVAIRAWEAYSDSGHTSTMYLHGRRVVREVWLPRATNIQAAYVDYVPFLFSLATFFPMWGQQTDRPGHSLLRCHAFLPFFNQETRDSFLSYWFSPFQPRCGFDASLLDSTISLPFLIQTRHELVCMK